MMRVIRWVAVIGWATLSQTASGFCGDGPTGMRPGDGRLAFCISTGRPRALATEIWTRPEGASVAVRARTYPGESGGLWVSGDGRELLYLELGLTRESFCSQVLGSCAVPIVRNRIWRLAADGSAERVWPLPVDLQAEGFVPNDCGDVLAVRGYAGPWIGSGTPGIWTVDSEGKADQVHRGHVLELLGWSDDGRAIQFRPADGEPQAALSVSVGATGSGGKSKGWVRAPVEVRSNPDPESRDLCKALNVVQMAAMRWSKSHRYRQEGARSPETELGKAAIRAFESLRKDYPDLSFSTGSCRAYVRAMKQRLDEKDSVREEAVCLERMSILQDLLEAFVQEKGHRPASVLTLRDWALERVRASAGGPAMQDRARTAVDLVVGCPVTRGTLEDSYLYRWPATPLRPLLRCLWHRNRYLALDETDLGVCLAVEDLTRSHVDSLFSEVLALCEKGVTDQAASLFKRLTFQRPDDAGLRIGAGRAYLAAGDHDRARGVYKEAISMGGGAEAYYGLGTVYAEMPNARNMAITSFRKALRHDRGFADAQYQIARLRYLMKEHDVEHEVNRLLDIDPEYADAYLLMGDWYSDFWEDYGQAITWYTRYMVMRPDDAAVAKRIGVAYLMVKDYERITATILTLVRENPDAVELMPIVAVGAYEQKKMEMAQEFFSLYLGRVDPKERAFYDDISLAASKGENEDVRGLSEQEREGYLARFWTGKDPDLTTPVNERQIEHYRRVWYARTSFSEAQQPWDARGEVYIRFGEPDHRSRSDDVNVQQSLEVQQVKERLAGLLYGQDWMGQSFVGPVYPVRSTGGPGGAGRELREVQIEGSMMPDDLSPNEEAEWRARSEAAEVARSQAGGSAGPPEGGSAGSDTLEAFGSLDFDKQLGFGGYRPVVMGGQDQANVPWETWVYADVGGGVEITFTDDFGSGRYGYAPVPPNQGEIGAAELAGLRRYSPRVAAARAAQATPDYYAPLDRPAALDFHYTLADFRGSRGKSKLEVYFGIPTRGRHYDPDSDVTSLTASRQAALLPVALDTVYRASGDLKYQAAGHQVGPGTFVPDQLALEVPPGRYDLEVRVLDRTGGQVGAYRQRVEVEAYEADALELSDLELAWHVAEGVRDAKFGKGNLSVTPMASRTFRNGQGVFVYYEVYNLSRDEFGQTHYKVEYTIRRQEGRSFGDVISRWVQTFKGKKQEEVVVGYELAGEEPFERVFVELTLPPGNPGKHTLKVQVTDLNSGTTAVKETVFRVGR